MGLDNFRSQSGYSGAFLLIAFVFGYRSFYDMCICSEVS